MPFSNDMAVNKLITTNLAAISTFENKRPEERQRQGVKVAKKNGKYFGKKPQLIKYVRDLKENKNLTITQITKVTGRGRNTIYKVLKQHLNYIPYNRLVKNPNPSSAASISEQRYKYFSLDTVVYSKSF